MPNCYVLLRAIDGTRQTMRYRSYKNFYSDLLIKPPWLDLMSNFWGSDQFGYVSFIYLADQANALEINYTNLYDTQSI